MKNGKKYDESEKKHIGVRKKKKVNQARTKGKGDRERDT